MNYLYVFPDITILINIFRTLKTSSNENTKKVQLCNCCLLQCQNSSNYYLFLKLIVTPYIISRQRVTETEIFRPSPGTQQKKGFLVGYPVLRFINFLIGGWVPGFQISQSFWPTKNFRPQFLVQPIIYLFCFQFFPGSTWF